MIIFSKWSKNMMLQGMPHSIINYFFLSISLILRLPAPGFPHVRDVREWVSGLFTSSLAGTCLWGGTHREANQIRQATVFIKMLTQIVPITVYGDFNLLVVSYVDVNTDSLNMILSVVYVKYLLEVLHWFMPSLRWALARSELVCFNRIYGQQ